MKSSLKKGEQLHTFLEVSPDRLYKGYSADCKIQIIRFP